MVAPITIGLLLIEITGADAAVTVDTDRPFGANSLPSGVTPLGYLCVSRETGASARCPSSAMFRKGGRAVCGFRSHEGR